MEETYLINRIKESCCFVSQNFSADLDTIKFKKGGDIKYILPDYSNNKEGYILEAGKSVQEDQQILALGNERFAIPEVLFTPSDVGKELERGRLMSRFEAGWDCGSSHSGCECFARGIEIYVTR